MVGLLVSKRGSRQRNRDCQLAGAKNWRSLDVSHLSAATHGAIPTQCLISASIAENQHRLNSNMKCSIDGNTARIPYVGTGDTKVLPLAQVLAGVQGLVSMLHKKNPRGSVCQYCHTPVTECRSPLSLAPGLTVVLMHSCDKDLSSLRHLGLPIDDWKLDLAPDESASKGTVYVIVRILDSHHRARSR